MRAEDATVAEGARAPDQAPHEQRRARHQPDGARLMLHPVLGRSFNAKPFDTCSKCGGVIPEERVPLILFGSRSLAWVYCERCEEPMLAEFSAQMKSKLGGAGAKNEDRTDQHEQRGRERTRGRARGSEGGA